MLKCSRGSENRSIFNSDFQYLFIKVLFAYLFSAVLGLRCCGGFSLVVASGGSAPVATLRFPAEVASLVSTCSGRAGFSSCGSRDLEHRLIGHGPRASLTLRQVGSSQIRNRAHLSCIGRTILHHWGTREALEYLYIKIRSPFCSKPVSGSPE